METPGLRQSSVTGLTDPAASGDATHTTDWLAEAQIVAASELLCRSPRLRTLLLFLAERTLTGERGQLSEYQVGRQVFHKGADWVPADDSIVRSSVRQLRLKLAEYYGQEGATRPWRIEIPRGSYVVSFRPAQLMGMGSRDAVQEGAAEGNVRQKRPWTLIAALSILLCLSAATNLVLVMGWGKAGPRQAMGLAAALTMQSPQPTRVVLDDFAHVLLSQMAGNPPSTVEGYAKREYTSPGLLTSQDPSVVGLWRLLTTRQIVSLGAAATLDRLIRSNPDPSKMVMVHARNMTAREFRSGNSIIVGSEPNNPWSQMFDGDLNFRRVNSGQGRVGFENGKPRPGEQPVYFTEQNASANSGQGVARVAYLSNGTDGFILLLSGVNMVTTEAAGEFVSDPDRLEEICRLFGVTSAQDLPHMEILLRTTSVDNSVHRSSVVAWRRLD